MKGCAMKTARIAALAAFLAIPLLAQGQMSKGKNHNKAVQEIIDFRNRYIEAEENKDIAYLDKIFADDFFALNPQGQLLDKPHMLENMKRTDRIFKVLNPRETQVHFYGNVAILSEHVTVDGEDKGRHFGGEFRFVRVFAKQHGNWQVVLAQGAPIPPQPADAK
jgi:ketosteroid isomerase-like protein